MVRFWLGYLSGARCRWFAYSPPDATATPSSLAPVKSRIYFCGAGLPRLSWPGKKAIKRMWCSSSSYICVCCRLCERALADAGLEFRSDKLWETYINWLRERGNRESVGKMASVLDRLLQTPTQHCKQHFTTLVFTSAVSVNIMLWRKELEI